MIKVYELNKIPQLGEVLTCRLYKKGDPIECARFVAQFQSQSDPVQIQVFRSDAIGFQVVMLELLEFNKFIDSPHWRDSVAKQWSRYGEIFEDEVFKANNA